MKFILGKKVGMSQYFDKDGKFVPVTLVEGGPCFVLQVKNKEKDGYSAVQFGFEKITKYRNIKKTAKGKEYKYVKEQRVIGDEKCNVGDKIDVSVFKEGDLVKIIGTSKGKGFQGAVKRHHFAGKCSTHGVKHQHRTIGSVGMRWPQRVVLGKRMPGRMGGERVTTKNLKIVKIEPENNLIILRGAVPGKKGSLLQIKG